MKTSIKRKGRLQHSLTLLCIILLSTNIFAQQKEWKTKKMDDGKITVKSCVSERIDENGNTVPLIEYMATTIEDISINKCVSVIKDVSKHKIFLTRTEKSVQIKAISPNEWIVYYCFSSWPFPDSDYVARMLYNKNNKEKTEVFTLTAEPTMYKQTDAKRFTYYDISYTFRDLGNGKTEISTTTTMSPLYNVPLWMIRAAISDSAADVIRKIVKLANEG